jgi:hypothetical protein
MTQNPTRIDHPKTISALNLRSHSIDNLNHYDRRINNTGVRIDLTDLLSLKSVYFFTL